MHKSMSDDHNAFYHCMPIIKIIFLLVIRCIKTVIIIIIKLLILLKKYSKTSSCVITRDIHSIKVLKTAIIANKL